MKRVLVLHGYSADNAGDGLLVRETLDLIREALGEDAEVTLLAARPDTFTELGVRALPTVPAVRGWDAGTRDVLKRIDGFDIVIGVGGGYLRAGTPVEALKTALVHVPQLRAAARASVPTVYLPQSIGPARFGTRRWAQKMLRCIDLVMVRDDRTMREIDVSTMRRRPDLATAAVVNGRRPGSVVDSVPVLSIREVRGRVNPDIYRLAESIGTYDGYIQSTVGGNDDRAASSTLSPRSVLARDELMTIGGQPRVVVAVRLHAALMALAAGHYVVHLAYERKGFGAFEDLEISPWVHSVNAFDPDAVRDQVSRLRFSVEERRAYDDRILSAAEKIRLARAQIVEEIRERAAQRP
ncbi:MULTISPECIES: polysaccharide pyruvyl transferase family protein [unclassified Microbacterium]|uniref:polysaccharide pyruvyl transferase family protein n=1 Tax=Microbacterium TaxID=33882 RepID=UPI003B9F5DD1